MSMLIEFGIDDRRNIALKNIIILYRNDSESILKVDHRLTNRCRTAGRGTSARSLNYLRNVFPDWMRTDFLGDVGGEFFAGWFLEALVLPVPVFRTAQDRIKEFSFLASRFQSPGCRSFGRLQNELKQTSSVKSAVFMRRVSSTAHFIGDSYVPFCAICQAHSLPARPAPTTEMKLLIWKNQVTCWYQVFWINLNGPSRDITLNLFMSDGNQPYKRRRSQLTAGASILQKLLERATTTYQSKFALKLWRQSSEYTTPTIAQVSELSVITREPYTFGLKYASRHQQLVFLRDQLEWKMKHQVRYQLRETHPFYYG